MDKIQEMDKKISKLYKKIEKLGANRYQLLLEQKLAFYKAFYDRARFRIPDSYLVDIHNQLAEDNIPHPEG